MAEDLKFFASLTSEEQRAQLERFRGICALYGYAGFAALQRAHAVIIGTGGVGSWLAESLCRTGVGTMTLVDFDTIELSNSNRQLHTMTSTVGAHKADELGRRLRDINPHLNLRVFKTALKKESIMEQMSEILMLSEEEMGRALSENSAKSAPSPDKAAERMRKKDLGVFVAEAIDDLQAKAACVDLMHRAGVPFVTSGGAGGRVNPSRLRLCDLSKSKGDQLLKRLRTELRRFYGYPSGAGGRLEDMRILCSSSDETPVRSEAQHPEDARLIEGIREETLAALPELPAFGASMSVTASAGLLLSSAIIRWIVQDAAAVTKDARRI